MKVTGQKKKKTGRGLGSSVSISSVGALLMFFIPWMVYRSGAGAAWVAIGAFIGGLLVWQLFSYRLMRFSLQQESVVTLPGFFSRRFMERQPVFRIFLSVVLVVVLLTAAAGILSWVGHMVSILFPVDPQIIEAGVLALSILLFLLFGRGGLRLADRWIAVLTLAALLIINLAVFRLLSGENILKNIFHSLSSGSVSEYVNMGYMSGKPLTAVQYISMISYGFLILGNPLVLQRFQQAENGNTIHRSRRWAVTFTLLSVFFAIFSGGMLRAGLYPAQIKTMEDFFLALKSEDPTTGFVFYTSCILFLVAAGLVAFDVMHACLLQASQILRDDLYHSIRKMIFGKQQKKKQQQTRRRKRYKKKHGKRAKLYEAKVRNDKLSFRKEQSFELLALLACIITGVLVVTVGMDILPVLRQMIISLACGLVPIVLLSLYSEKMNLMGVWSAFFSGALFSVFWDLIPVIPQTIDQEETLVTLSDLTGINSVLPGMAFGILVGLIMMKVGRKPSPMVKEAFEQVKYRYVTSEEE